MNCYNVDIDTLAVGLCVHNHAVFQVKQAIKVQTYFQLYFKGLSKENAQSGQINSLVHC